MGFGKRTGGPPNRQPEPTALIEPAAPAQAHGMIDMTAVKKKSGLDAGFAALVLGVVAVSAGGAFALPSLFSIGAHAPMQIRPISAVVAGLDREQAKAALAKEAFPDSAGGAFMATLKAYYPDDHQRLLGRLADEAMKGADRDRLFAVVNEWSVEFAPSHFSAIGRSGAKGFDEALAVFDDALMLIEKTNDGDCTLDALQKLTSDPSALDVFRTYGSEGYNVSMRAARKLVELAAAGRDAKRVEARFTAEDQRAIQNLGTTIMQDPQINALMQKAMGASMRGGSRQQMEAQMMKAAQSINVCRIGHTLIAKLKDLPEGTRARLWGLATDANALRSIAKL